MSEEVYHIPALLPECIEALDIQPGGIYVDATYGGGGHSRAIIEHLDASAGGHLYSFDRAGLTECLPTSEYRSITLTTLSEDSHSALTDHSICA